MQDGQDRAVARGIQKFVGMPRGGQRSGFGLAVADHARHDEFGIVEHRTEGMTQRIAEFTAFVNRARTLRRSVARNSAGKRELRKQPFQTSLILADVGIDLAVGTFEISMADDGGTAVPRPRHVDHVHVVFLDDPIQMRVDEILSRSRAPVPQQHALDVRKRQRLAQQRVVAQIDLSHGEVIGRAPVGIHFARGFRIEWRCRSVLLHDFKTPQVGVNCSSRMLEAAITDSSLVRITRTVTEYPVSAEMRCAWRRLASSSMPIPRYSKPSQMRLRTGAAFSPMPPANTKVSRPPSAATNAPIHFFAW